MVAPSLEMVADLAPPYCCFVLVVVFVGGEGI